nr:type II toxin-antitoxin system RelE/ParE family toxin [Methylosinus sp. RM1]
MSKRRRQLLDGVPSRHFLARSRGAVRRHLSLAERATPSAAERFTAAIVDYCESLRSFPERGTCRDDLRPGLRTIGFRRRATIAFAVEADVVTIVGVFYGGQDFEASLSIDDG